MVILYATLRVIGSTCGPQAIVYVMLVHNIVLKRKTSAHARERGKVNVSYLQTVPA